jgi:hypothetical protein
MAEAAADQLQKDLESPEFRLGVNRKFWRFVRRYGDRVYIACTAWDGDEFLLELHCDNYGVEPCRGLFVDSDTGQCVSGAWPQGDSIFGNWFKWQPGNFFICWPADRGGIGRHPEWRAQTYWKKTSNPLVHYLEFIRRCLTIRGNGYQSRRTLSRAS